MVWVEEVNFKVQTIIAGGVLVSAYILDFALSEFGILIIAIFMVLSAEIINTAVEDLCNRVESGIDPIIEKVKDMMAGYVLFSSLAALALGALVIVRHFLA
jgi:diacylglycerol kinase